ncbi:hypothetical protein DL239_03300 [Sedimentitalea sp. CY04]|uniref:Uncharacterized protein n=1 Tax=Parasedimentitalea denitrificans TaxID=2211118 RepID=A0ABX0W360_9RHOB|nr:hypothetical protein [Sedimentitalea sp. CY04]
MGHSIAEEVAEIRDLLKTREYASGELSDALKKARRRLPRRVYKQGMLLAKAEPLMDHPKLRLTLDEPALLKSAGEVLDYLKSIDLADRRKGRVLTILGSLAFSLLVVLGLAIAVMRWRGLI